MLGVFRDLTDSAGCVDCCSDGGGNRCSSSGVIIAQQVVSSDTNANFLSTWSFRLWSLFLAVCYFHLFPKIIINQGIQVVPLTNFTSFLSLCFLLPYSLSVMYDLSFQLLHLGVESIKLPNSSCCTQTSYIFPLKLTTIFSCPSRTWSIIDSSLLSWVGGGMF